MTEKQLYHKLKQHYTHCGWLVERIENGSINPGFPDTIFIKQGTILFVELKVVLKKETITIPYRPGQLAKLQAIDRHGGNVLVCLGIDNLWYFCPPTEKIPFSELLEKDNVCYTTFKL